MRSAPSGCGLPPSKLGLGGTQGNRANAALLHGGFERRDGAVVESFMQRVGNRLARVCAFA